MVEYQLNEETTYSCIRGHSVYGGVFDPEFSGPSSAFFSQVQSGRFNLAVSQIIETEIAQGPRKVRALLDRVRSRTIFIPVSSDIIALQDTYLREGIVQPKWRADALHVATASVAGCRMIVSWNFKHIVHFDKIAHYNAINIREGFGSIGIFSPQEVITYED